MTETVRDDGQVDRADLDDFLRDDFPVAQVAMDDGDDEEDPVVGNEALLEAPRAPAQPHLRVVAGAALNRADDIEDAPLDDLQDPADYRRDAEEMRREKLRENPFFITLGYFEGLYYYLNRKLCSIVTMPTGKITQNMLISLAPLDFWTDIAAKLNTSTAEVEPNWNVIFDSLYRQAEDLPMWDPKREFKQGAIMDEKEPVFHTGRALRVGNETMHPGEMSRGYYRYSATIPYAMPDFDNAYGDDSDEIRKFIEILRAIDWREGSSSIAIMVVLGYVALAPLCGLLKWRPHVWLDGPWGTGKTWFIENILSKALGEYYESVKANSTEPGLRSSLAGRAIPLIFDEAEGATPKDKERMDGVIGMIRHTSSESKAMVTQGAPGGGLVRQYAIRSMFFLASITTRLITPADRSRFARISLGLTGHTAQQFQERVAQPAEDLLTPEFSERLVARIFARISDLAPTIDTMTRALRDFEIDQRIASVYGVFAAGAWLSLRSGKPESKEEAAAFMLDTFGAIEPIIDANRVITEGRDHQVVLNEIMSAQLRIQTPAGPAMEPIGSLMRLIAGEKANIPSDVPLEAAQRALGNIGIRGGIMTETGGKVCKPDERPDCFLFRKQAPEIRKILINTPYDSNYAEIMQQDRSVRLAGTVAFPGAIKERPVLVPLANLGIDPGRLAEAEEDQ